MNQPRLVLSCVIAGLISSTAIVACGDDEPSAASTPAASASVPSGALPPNILTEADVKGQPEDSPGRALLQWAQAIQFSDSDGVAALSTPEAVNGMGGRTKLDKAVKLMGSSFSRITIAGTDKTDDTHVRVRVWLSNYDANGKRTTLTPSTFPFVKVDGQWKMEKLTLIAATLRDLEARERSQQQ